MGGRPRKTAEELDAEMEDYWGAKGGANGASNGSGAAAAAPDASTVGGGDDVDMIE